MSKNAMMIMLKSEVCKDMAFVSIPLLKSTVLKSNGFCAIYAESVSGVDFSPNATAVNSAGVFLSNCVGCRYMMSGSLK
jgi:hypothetical protein